MVLLFHARRPARHAKCKGKGDGLRRAVGRSGAAHASPAGPPTLTVSIPGRYGNVTASCYEAGSGGRLARRSEDPFDLVQRDLGTLVGRLMGDFFAPLARDAGAPRLWDLDVSENDREVVVRAEVPGFEENELDIQLNGDVLTIRGEKENRGDGREEYRSYFQAVTLPPGVNPEAARARYRNGVLELHIPRPEESRPRRIAIQGGQSATGREEQPFSTGQSGAAASRAGGQPQQGEEQGTTAKGKK